MYIKFNVPFNNHYQTMDGEIEIHSILLEFEKFRSFMLLAGKLASDFFPFSLIKGKIIRCKEVLLVTYFLSNNMKKELLLL